MNYAIFEVAIKRNECNQVTGSQLGLAQFRWHAPTERQLTKKLRPPHMYLRNELTFNSPLVYGANYFFLCRLVQSRITLVTPSRSLNAI